MKRENEMQGLGGQERLKGRWSSERSSTKEKRLEKRERRKDEGEREAEGKHAALARSRSVLPGSYNA